MKRYTSVTELHSEIDRCRSKQQEQMGCAVACDLRCKQLAKQLAAVPFTSDFTQEDSNEYHDQVNELRTAAEQRDKLLRGQQRWERRLRKLKEALAALETAPMPFIENTEKLK